MFSRCLYNGKFHNICLIHCYAHRTRPSDLISIEWVCWMNEWIDTTSPFKLWCNCLFIYTKTEYMHMCSVLSNSATLWTVVCQTAQSMGFLRQEYWSGLPFPLQRVFQTQGSHPHLLCFWHCRGILYWSSEIRNMSKVIGIQNNYINFKNIFSLKLKV